MAERYVPEQAGYRHRLKEQYDRFDSFPLLRTKAIYNTLLQGILSARSRVLIETTWFQGGEYIDPLLGGLKRLDRSTDARIFYDYNALLTNDDNYHLILHNHMPTFKEFRANQRSMFDDLERYGIRTRQASLPRTLEEIFLGNHCNHAKSAVLDNMAMILSMSFTPNHFRDEEIAAQIKDPKLVALFAKYYDLRWNNALDRFVRWETPDGQHRLIGTDWKNEHIIEEELCERIAKAKKHVGVVTQFMPDGDVGYALQLAHNRGVQIDYITNDYQHLPTYLYKLGFVTNKPRHTLNGGFPVLYFPDFVHGKLATVDHETVAIGSHNFTNTWLHMGELCLISRNKALAGNAADYLNDMKVVAVDYTAARKR